MTRLLRAIAAILVVVTIGSVGSTALAAGPSLTIRSIDGTHAPTVHAIVQYSGPLTSGVANITVRENDVLVPALHVTPLREIPVENLLPRLRDQRIAQGYRIRDARDSVRQGYASLAVVYESNAEVVYSLYVVTLSRIYEARVAVPRAEAAAIVPHRQRFFQSLRIL